MPEAMRFNSLLGHSNRLVASATPHRQAPRTSHAEE